MSKLRRTFSEKFNKKADSPRIFSGLLGDGYGTVDAGNGKAYVRISNTVNTAVCSSVPYVNNLPVWVGYTTEFPTILRVLGQQSSSSSEFIDGVGKHAKQHEWMGSGVLGGTDVVNIHLQQFLPLMVMPYSGLQVMIYPGIAWIGSAYDVIANANSYGKPVPITVDLEPYAVLNNDKEKYLLIGIDTSGNIEIVEGSEVDREALTPSDIPAASITMIYKLAAVRRYSAQTEIVVNRDTVDIVDLRFPMWKSVDLDDVVGTMDWDSIDFTNSDLADLTIKSHTSLSDIGTQTHAELETAIGGKAETVHTHAEADITDLDHDAVKISGVDVDLTGITDGQVIKYDLATTTLIAGDDEGGGTLDELTDVVITTPADGQALVYDSGNWVNSDIVSGGSLPGVEIDLGSFATDKSDIDGGSFI